jgi:5'-3' exonuclease
VSKLLLCDGTNITMRCAFGGDIQPPEAIISATAMIERVARDCGASHLVVAFDHPDEPTWRHQLYPEYKAGRKTDTSPWIIAAVAVLSSDSDLLPLTVAGVEVLRPLGGQAVQSFGPADVCEKYQIPAAHLLYDFKAMTGEAGDNIPGVPGIGMKRAADLLRKYGDLESIIEVGRGKIEKYSAIAAEHEASARLSLKLVSLHPDAPIAPINPSSCALNRVRSHAA